MEIGGGACGQMTDELYSNAGESSTSKRQQLQQVAVNSGEQLDIEAYAALYSGRTRIMRLLFIGEKCHNVSMQLEALRMAYDEIKKGEDTTLFREVVQKIDGRLGPDYGLDLGWIDVVDRKTERTKKQLEFDLNAYRKSLNREDKRMGYKDYGDFYYAHGALGDALRNYAMTDDYCRNEKHAKYMFMNAILVSIEIGNFHNVLIYIRKAMQLKLPLDCITLTKLQCAGGLAHLKNKKYKHAALKFLEITPELGDCYSEVIAAQDVATYGGLCALASFDRAELKANVIENIKFHKFLEFVPQVRELIHDFYSSRYASCLDYLANLKPNLLLDIHLHEHVEILYKQIRTKAILQYTCPYVSVDMNLMATAFKTTVTELQKELGTLIISNHIKAKIDSVNKVMYAHHANERNSTFQQVLQTGSIVERDVRAMMQRFNLIKNRYNRKA